MRTETGGGSTEAAWAGLETALAEWLEDIPPDEWVILELPWPDASDKGTAPYIQVLIDGYDVHAEASGNDVLDPLFQLEDERVQAMTSLGWDQPTDVIPNFCVDEELPEDASVLATRLVATLRDVFGVPDPSFLLARGLDEDDEPLDEGDLPFGLRVPEHEAAAVADPTVDPTVVLPRDVHDLRDLVAEVVSDVTGEPAEFDPDGDIPVQTEHSVVYVRVEEEHPIIRLWAPALLDVSWTPRVGYELNRVNAGAYFFRVVHAGQSVRVEVELAGTPFVPELLRTTVRGMCATTDRVATQLQEHLGGRLMDQPPGQSGPRRRRV